MTKKKDIDLGDDLQFQITRLESVIEKLQLEADESYQRGYSRGYKAGYKEAEIDATYYEDDEDDNKTD